jgi:hypothetical protein
MSNGSRRSWLWVRDGSGEQSLSTSEAVDGRPSDMSVAAFVLDQDRGLACCVPNYDDNTVTDVAVPRWGVTAMADDSTRAAADRPCRRPGRLAYAVRRLKGIVQVPVTVVPRPCRRGHRP